MTVTLVWVINWTQMKLSPVLHFLATATMKAFIAVTFLAALSLAAGVDLTNLKTIDKFMPVNLTHTAQEWQDIYAAQIASPDYNHYYKGTEPQPEPGTAPRNVQVRPLSSSTIVIRWDEPETPNGQVTGYKVYYTVTPTLGMASWESQMVDNNQLTTISDLTPHTIYTIRVQAFTSVGPGPLSAPVLVKTQQGVPSQPSNLRTSKVGETSVTLQWSRPAHAGENIVSYELYWNDTYAKERHHRRIAVAESYTLTGLYPNTLYNVWLAARSRRGEGATTLPIPVRTKQYGKTEWAAL